MGDEFIYPPSAGKSGPSGQPDDRGARLVKQAAAAWDSAVKESPLQRLRYCDARLARAGFVNDPAERERLKARVAQLIREAGAKVVLSDPHVVCMVRELFGERGVLRLKQRAKEVV